MDNEKMALFCENGKHERDISFSSTKQLFQWSIVLKNDLFQIMNSTNVFLEIVIFF